MHLQKIELPKRKTWNKEEFAQRAKDRKEREEKEALNLDLDQLPSQATQSNKQPSNRGAVVKRDLLRPRKHDINLSEKVGKRQEITDDTAAEDRSAWYCSVCKCQLKDSHTYLDHINGKKHQRMLGMSMKTPVSTLQQVRNRLEYHRKRSRNEIEQTMDVAERIELRKAKEQRQKELRKQARKKRKLAEKQAQSDTKYGSTFNHTKSTHNESTSKNKETTVTEYVAEGNDPEMEAMGFTFSFGGSKKT